METDLQKSVSQEDVCVPLKIFYFRYITLWYQEE